MSSVQYVLFTRNSLFEWILTQQQARICPLGVRPMNKAQKMVRMVELMTRRGGVTAMELRERFDLDSRSFRRYLADLREIDVPIIDEGRGDDRLISIDARWRRTGVQLTLAEVLSLHFGRTLFNFLEGTSFAADKRRRRFTRSRVSAKIVASDGDPYWS